MKKTFFRIVAGILIATVLSFLKSPSEPPALKVPRPKINIEMREK